MSKRFGGILPGFAGTPVHMRRVGRERGRSGDARCCTKPARRRRPARPVRSPGARWAASSHAARTAPRTSSRQVRSRAAARILMESVRCFPRAATMPASRIRPATGTAAGARGRPRTGAHGSRSAHWGGIPGRPAPGPGRRRSRRAALLLRSCLRRRGVGGPAGNPHQPGHGSCRRRRHQCAACHSLSRGASGSGRLRRLRSASSRLTSSCKAALLSGGNWSSASCKVSRASTTSQHGQSGHGRYSGLPGWRRKPSYRAIALSTEGGHNWRDSSRAVGSTAPPNFETRILLARRSARTAPGGLRGIALSGQHHDRIFPQLWSRNRVGIPVDEFHRAKDAGVRCMRSRPR